MNQSETTELIEAARAVAAAFPGTFEVTGYDGEGETHCLFCGVESEVDPAWRALSDARSAWRLANPYPQFDRAWKAALTEDEKKDYQRMANRVQREMTAWSKRCEVEAPVPDLREIFNHSGDCAFDRLRRALDPSG